MDKTCRVLDNTAAGISDAYTKGIDHYMCSQTCPCPDGDNNKIKDYWTGLGDSTLRKFNRVKSIDSLTENQKIAYRYYGDVADITPLVFGGGRTFSTFE